MKKILLITVLLLTLPSTVIADIITLKNGSVLECEIISENENSIEVEIYGGKVRFEMNEIKSIRKLSPEEKKKDSVRDTSTLVKALLGHWIVFEDKARDSLIKEYGEYVRQLPGTDIHFYFSPSKFVDTASEEERKYWILESDEKENWAKIRFTNASGKEWDKTFTFSADRKRAVITWEDPNDPAKWLRVDVHYVDNKQEPSTLKIYRKEKELAEKEEVNPDRKSKIIYYLANTKYIYKNMAASYVELSVTYSYCYENPKFIGWDVVVDPNNPIAVLATAKFKTTGVQADILNAPDSEVSYSVKKKMKEAVPLLPITWRVNDLIGLKITPYNFYAEDAISVYKDIVKGMWKLAE